MSTKSSVAFTEYGDIGAHLYHEMHDDCFHLLIGNDHCNSQVDVVIPKWMVKDLAKIIEQASQPETDFYLNRP